MYRCDKAFGKFYALKNVNLTINPNELIGIVGPNGAGKTTLFNVITNVGYRLTTGMIKIDGNRIDKLKPHQIRQMGITKTFQTPSYFSSFTCRESVKPAIWCNKKISSIDDQGKSVLELRI